MRQCVVLCSIVAFNSAIIQIHANTHLPRSQQRSYLRFQNSLPINDRHDKTKVDRNLIEKGDWDEDDDDYANNSIPFHEQDDDATNDSNQAPTMEENEAESYLERYNDGRNENSAKIKEDEAKKEEGIVYSDTAGDKESGEEQVAPLPPPPPPPLPSADKSTVDGDDQQQKEEEEEKIEAVEEQIDADVAEQNIAASENDPVVSTTNQNNATSTKHENEQLQPQEQEPLQADTIFDDLLRGFTFAATFCVLIIGIYKFCGYACVKCGICPDERVMRARWRRSRLKRKRAYGESNVVPPLDTRKWAEWSAKRGRVNGGVWDSGFDDIESNVGRDDGSEAGAIVFDNSGIEMAEWEDNDDDSGSEMILEFGEGDELEDKSHDERMFDAEDGGKGVEKEATNFFENRSQKNVSDDTASAKKRNASEKSDVNIKSVVEEKKEESGTAILFNASFDALDPPSGENGFASTKPDKNTDSSSAAKDFLLEVSSDQSNLNTNHDKTQNDEDNEEMDKSFVSADDRGYDEDADLLGLRSDSPPPLDLEEIEKNLVENMNNAKFY